jgi:mannitol-specific phosphotransferase system IIBC component
VVEEAVNSQYFGSVVIAVCGVLLGVLVTLVIASVTYKLSHHTLTSKMTSTDRKTSENNFEAAKTLYTFSSV